MSQKRRPHPLKRPASLLQSLLPSPQQRPRKQRSLQRMKMMTMSLKKKLHLQRRLLLPKQLPRQHQPSQPLKHSPLKSKRRKMMMMKMTMIQKRRLLPQKRPLLQNQPPKPRQQLKRPQLKSHLMMRRMMMKMMVCHQRQILTTLNKI